MVIVPNQESIIFKDIIWFIVGTVLFTLIITAAFFITIRALLQQKKLSEIKSDFINNMTHEFKTPLATISLAVDALKNDQVKKDDDKSAYFIHVIKEENKRMNSQVEAILQAALLDQKNFELQTKAGSVHEYIHQAVKNIQLPLEEKNGTIELELNAANDTVNANDVHFINLINSLLDNAVKYSKDSLKIKVSTQNKANQIQIVISDNGIGMTNETLKRIFEKFYRAHTGNIHNVKGFGLGLSYVKTMVEAHHGTIKANSEIDKGSVFTLSFPTV
jgi:two-component system phosphate regulon sensor histidine kinase PhoR